jgi:hypothetical protein
MHSNHSVATEGHIVICRACAGAMEAVEAMLLLWAIACTPSGAVANALSPATGPPAEAPIAGDGNIPAQHAILDDADMSLEVVEAERFTNLSLSVFRKIYRTRTTTCTTLVSS